MQTNKHQISKRMFLDTMIVLIVAELTGAVACVIDGLVISRYLGSDAIAAYGIACTYFSIVCIVSGVLLVGCQTVCVELISKGKKDDCSRVMSLSSLIGFIIAVLFSICIYIFPRQISLLFGAREETPGIFELISPYLKGVAFGGPFWLVYMILTPLVQLDGGGRRAKIASLTAAIVNIVLDMVLGVWLKMGMFGMGLATAISRIVCFIITAAHFFTKKSSFRFTFKNFYFKKLGAIIRNGLPRSICMISRTIGPILLNIIVMGVDSANNTGMAALSVQRSISFLVASVGWGICGAVLMLETMYYNEKNISEIKSIIGYAIKSIIIFVGACTVIFVLLSPLIARIFLPNWKEDTALYELSIVSLRYYIISLPFVAFNISFASYIQSVGKITAANVVNACVECVSLVFACYFLSKSNQYVGFFAGFFVGELTLSIALVIYVFIHKLIHKGDKYSLYFIKKGYINENDKVMEATINNYDDVIALSKKASELCVGTKLSSSQIYKLSLGIEEMAMNVFEHGMKKDNKKHHVEIRVVVSDDQAVITLIDDCKKFDITKKLSSWEINPDAPEKNIGIRMIMLIAKKVIYSNTMNINNLQIII